MNIKDYNIKWDLHFSKIIYSDKDNYFVDKSYSYTNLFVPYLYNDMTEKQKIYAISKFCDEVKTYLIMHKDEI